MKTIFTHSTKLVTLLVLSFISFSSAVAQTAPVIFPYNGFDIDGNLKANTPTADVGDWISGTGGSGQFVFNNDGSAVNTVTTYRFTDAYNSTGDNIFTGGGKFDDNPNTLWSWTNSKPGGKGDINNVLIHLGVDTNNKQWLIIASDRLVTTGTSYIDFEFFKNPISANAGGSFTLAGGRTVGDILLSVEYSNGGSTANVKFYRWNGSGYSLVTDSAANAFGKTNIATVDTIAGTAFGTSQYTAYQFVEAAINISAFLELSDPCEGAEFGSVLIKTKSSDSPSAALDDFAGPYPIKLVLGTASISYGDGSFCKNEGLVNVSLSGVTGGTFSAPSGLIINSTTGQIDITNSTSGTYTVTYSFSTGGCPKTVTTSVSINPMPIAAIGSVVNASCNSGTNGSATASATSGTSPYSYSWNTTPVQITATATGLGAGTYTVTVTDIKGCTDTEQVTITEPSTTLALGASSKTDASCFGDSTGSVTAGTVTNAVGTATYSWRNSSNIVVGTTATVSNLPQGIYTLTVSDNCFTRTNSVTIDQPSVALSASITAQTNVFCFGNNTASVTVAGANGTAPYTYSKDGIAFVASGTFSGLTAGPYTITVKDANGCTTTQAVTITQPTAALSASITAQTNVLCFGNNTASVTVAGANGTAPYTYSKDGITFVASGTFSGLTAGPYTITVKDANSCTTTQAVTITQPAIALSASITAQTNVLCFGNNTASVTVAGASGTTPYTYSKDAVTFVGSGVFSGLTADPYTITVKDANGCTTTQAVTITQPTAALSASITAQTNVLCFGNNTASVTVAGANGTAPYTYSKDAVTFVGSGIFSGLTAGPYTITVKDANGCTTTQAVTITQPAAALTASTTAQTNVLCFGNNTASVTVAGANGTSPYTYSKDAVTFVGSGTFSGLTAGPYTITVKDANGCTTTQAVTITQPTAALTASITAQTNVLCFGNNTASVTVAGANGTSPYTYSKDAVTFVGSGTFSGLTAGSYTITVKDANGCTTTQAVTITQPAAALSASITGQTNVLCFGNNTASVTVAGANGTAPYTYSKDAVTFVGSDTFSGLTAGSYTITVKDANGCTTTQAVTITQPAAALSASITTQTNVLCFGNNTASVTVAGANGTAPYTYSKNGITFVSSGIFSGLTAGSYTITVKDANACTTTQAVTITQPTATLSASITAQTNVLCFGDNTASVNVAGANGTAPYTYSKDGITFVASGVFSGLTAGSYTITVKDANACTTTQAVTITQPAIALSASITAQTNVLCFGNNIASVTVAGANGTAPYTYSKDGTTFVGSGIFSGLTAGPYTITVKDTNGCTTTQAVTITQPAIALSASITAQTNVLCFGNNTASVTVTGANGTAPYTYSKEGITFASSGVFSGLTAGSYTITVKDANACTTTQAVTITQPAAALSASITAQTNVLCFGNNTASVTVAGANGTAPYTYSKNGITFVASGIFSGLTVGSYTITVKDANGCTTAQAVTITQPTAALTASITAQTNVFCFGDNTASVTVAGANGTAPYTYSKDGTTFVASGTFSNLTIGSYTITVKDANSCTTTQAVTITQPTAGLSATAVIINNNNCVGCSNGSIIQTVTGGTSPYTYTWSNLAITKDLTNLAKGTYSVEIKDSKGCTINKEYTITESGIALVKKGLFIDTNEDGFAQVGEKINYTFSVTNIGNVNVSNVVISDPLLGAINITGNPIALIIVGQTNNTVTGTYTLTQADINAGKVINSATALGKDTENKNVTDISGTAIDNDIPTETLLIQVPEITITKDGTYVDNNHDGITNVGDLVTYNFVVKNTGNVTLTNVTVTDNNAVITGGPIATLAVGATDSTTFSGSHVITQGDIDTGYVYNLATVTAKDPKNNPVTDTSSDPTPCTSCPIKTDCPDCTITQLTQSPKIALVKNNDITVGENGCAALAVGSVVTYTFTVTNPGNVSLHNVAVIDPHAGLSAIALQSGDANNNSILEVGETWIYKATYNVTQADIDNGTITNQAAVNATAPNNAIVTDQSGNLPTNNNPNVIPICTNPSIALVKNNDITVGENGCAALAVGSVVTYTFTVTNPGNVSLHNVAVIDPHAGLSAIALQSGDANNNSILEVGETWIYKATYNVTQADIDNGTITNQAAVNAAAPNNAIVTDQSGNLPTNNNPNVIPICTNPSIALVKNNDITVGENGCAALAVGSVVTYTFTVTNPGNVSLHNVAVIDPHAGLSTIALQSGDANNNSILEVSETWMYKATYNVTQADIDNGTITNQAAVNAAAPNNAIVTDQSGNLPTNNNPNVIPICTNPSIALVKNNDITVGENGCAALAVGSVVTYTFTVTNPGNVSLHNVAVIDPHAGLSAIALQSGDANNNSILEVGETWIYKATYNVTQADIDNGTITNQAAVNAAAPNNAIVTDQSGNLPTNNNPNVIPICTNPKIALVKNNDITVGENGCAALAVGSVVTYTFIVTNPGNVSLHNIAVIDPHAGLSAIALQSGDANNNSILEVSETWMYKATYNVTQADIDNGTITNQATVNGTAPNDAIVTDQSGNLPTNNNPNVITFCINPGLTVVKIATTSSYSAVGNVINYTINIKNTGNVTLHEIAVKDPLTGLDTIIEVLAPGASSEYAQSYTVIQEDLNKGSITNIATADGLTPNNTPISATDDEVVNENANPIDAVDDNTGTVVGVNQITANVINVFTNDTLNALALNPTDVILTTVTSNPYLQLNPNGSIDVLADAPVGIQTMTYQICEKLNSTNCDTATVTVTIEAPTMKISGEGICINDVPYFSYTATADNFTPVNGLTLTWTDSNNNVIATMTNLPLNGKVLWPGATVDQNGNGTDWPGWVFADGKWSESADGFEGLRPTASITFTLNPSQTIIVNYPASDPMCTARPTFKIDAVDDAATTLEGLAGVKNILTVFKNDSLNTLALNPADVTLSVLIPDPKGDITLNTDGSIDVKANTPTGIYTLTYQICEKADNGNCDTAIVTINVTNIPLVIKANPDTYSVTQCSIGEAVRNALSNDLLNGTSANISDLKFKLLSVIGQNITIDDNGNVAFLNGVAAGQYIFNYQICEAANLTNCSTSTITINVAGIEPITITSPAFCNADTTLIDLNSLLPQGTATTGSWVDTDNTGGISGSLLNAIGIPVGKYKYEYKIGGDCPRSIFLEMVINDDCKVLPCKTIIIHNALSANEDGKNDYFQIENLEDNDCYKNIKVEIFNRWGVLVFERENYDNAGNAFRGRSEGRTTINKNEGLPTGTYFYIISYDTVDGVGQTQNIKKDGYLYLVK
ncbi:putative repeat protein (TIGR01451 family)/gliding motility-associated-like protein [Flavobacterium sp. 1]|uniref:DUF7507 domain-containing protein n=1 Tax=Flavobacterium sp. 1 TaxID=2035200 RepID=UPI000C249666|nr:gliding motility-associated C-terminal domain-containing protein [Flavobacterium sp. 1]PJJ08180.1 putative repeat protein (TIGR01451 family)/gliding motility-associated-like protein [Flavobacterium sp. 1]